LDKDLHQLTSWNELMVRNLIRCFINARLGPMVDSEAD
jgi:hypothetical protein